MKLNRLSRRGEARGMVWVWGCAMLATAGSAGAASFIGIGDLAGGTFESSATAVSADGSVVVGQSRSNLGPTAVMWTSAGGVVALGELPGGIYNGLATGISPDGKAIVGRSFSANGIEAFHYDVPSAHLTALGDLAGGSFDSVAHAVAPGIGVSSVAVAVGYGTTASGRSAVMWTISDTFAVTTTDLGELPGGFFGATALGITPDRSAVVGSSNTTDGLISFLWTTSNPTLAAVPRVPGVGINSEATAITPDQSVIVGWSDLDKSGNSQAFRWTSATGSVALGDLPGGLNHSVATDVSANGLTIVGSGATTSDSAGDRAFVWDPVNGMRDLKTVLIDQGVTGLTGWTLTQATGISADGLTIVGMGTNPNGRPEGWRARLSAASTVPVDSVAHHDLVFPGHASSLSVDFENATAGPLNFLKAEVIGQQDLDPAEALALFEGVTTGLYPQIWRVTTDATFTSAELTFEYDPAALPAGFDETALAIYHYTGGAWFPGGEVDPLANTITLTVGDFSPFSLGLILRGDANLDGVIDADDFALIDRGFARGLIGRANGDFNVDGVIDLADYLVIDQAFAGQSGLSPDFLAARQARFGEAYVAALMVSVPEPETAALALGGAALARGRRRR